MVNRTGKGTFGKGRDPVKAGKKSKPYTKVKAKMKKQLRDIQKLPYNEYMEKVQSIDPSIEDPDFLTQIFLSGEKGFEYLMTKELKIISENTSRAMAKTNDAKEIVELAKQRFYLWDKAKNTIYGTKQRVEAKVEDTSKVQTLFDSLTEDLPKKKITKKKGKK